MKQLVCLQTHLGPPKIGTHTHAVPLLPPPLYYLVTAESLGQIRQMQNYPSMSFRDDVDTLNHQEAHWR